MPRRKCHTGVTRTVHVTRSAPTDCRNEPGYPLHDTVVMGIAAPDLTAHPPTRWCPIEPPHPIAECGEFYPLRAPSVLAGLEYVCRVALER